jgi:signal transduction histidine kinase
MRMLRSLRARLLLGYTALALLSVVLASGAALALFGGRLQRDAQVGMVREAERAAERLEDRLALLPVADEIDDRELTFALRRGLGPGATILVDGEGRPVGTSGRGGSPPTGGASGRQELDIRPRGFGGERWRGSESALGDLESLRLPPPGRIGNRPAVVRFEPPQGPAIYYAAAEAPAAASRLGIDEAYVIVMRPAREVRGLWRTMLPSVALAGSLAVLVGGLAALALARAITRPVEAVTHGSARLAAGDHAVRVPVEGADEFQTLARSFNAMARDVGEAHRRQRELVVNVGHDLRTPLTTIRGFAEALQDGTARSESQREAALGAITGAASRMDGLVEELLELARLEGQAGGLERGIVSVADLLATVASDARGEAVARGVELRIDVPDELTAWLDRRWMTRALLNVVINGIQHGPRDGTVEIIARPAGGEGLGASPPDSSTKAEFRPGPVEILVRDSGPGIPTAQRERVFERFYRGDPSRRAGGTGLGLAIAREVVVAHGGRITILDEAEALSTFSVRLPGQDELPPA